MSDEYLAIRITEPSPLTDFEIELLTSEQAGDRILMLEEYLVAKYGDDLEAMGDDELSWEVRGLETKAFEEERI